MTDHQHSIVCNQNLTYIELSAGFTSATCFSLRPASLDERTALLSD